MPCIVISATSALGIVFYVRSQTMMEQQLRSHLRDAAIIASLSVDAALLDNVTGPESVDTLPYAQLIHQLDAVRDQLHNVRFVYIMRKTDLPDVLEFVADADATLTPVEMDRDGDGTIEEDEKAVQPGEAYDIAATTAMHYEAFSTPVVDQAVKQDRWGRLVSGYAPIRTDDGRVVGIAGVDMSAEDFYTLSRSIFSPIGVMLVVLAGVIWASYVVITIRRRHMEAYSQLDAERKAIIDLATHQLGMPIATFRWWLEIMKEQKINATAEMSNAYAEMQEGLDRMNEIVQSLMVTSHLQDDNYAYKAEKVDFDEMMKTVVKQTAPLYRRKHQKLNLEIEPDLPPVTLDHKLFVGVMRELVENASFYSPDERTMTVAAHRKGNKLHMQIRDQGYGIPYEDLPYVFDKFRRGSNAVTHRPVGNGLGLYIAKRIVERAHGKISIDSTIDKGTAINITLPLAE